MFGDGAIRQLRNRSLPLSAAPDACIHREKQGVLLTLVCHKPRCNHCIPLLLLSLAFSIYDDPDKKRLSLPCMLSAHDLLAGIDNAS